MKNTIVVLMMLVSGSAMAGEREKATQCVYEGLSVPVISVCFSICKSKNNGDSEATYQCVKEACQEMSQYKKAYNRCMDKE